MLAAIVAFAFLVEATVGFGATLLTVTLAAHLLPVEEVLARFLPVNLLLSAWMVTRNRALVDVPFVRGLVPWMGAGVAVGLALYRLHEHAWIKTVFGGVVVVMALLELARSRATTAEPLPPWGRRLALGAAGITHGLFACAGPLVVWVASREMADKGRFRATLAAVWLLFGIVLNTRYVLAGDIGLHTLGESALLLGPLALGIACGGLLHDHVPQQPFRIGVYVLLVLAGLSLVG